jgi:hypothetical protein
MYLSQEIIHVNVKKLFMFYQKTVGFPMNLGGCPLGYHTPMRDKIISMHVSVRKMLNV